MNSTLIAIGQIKPNPNNPRTIKDVKYKKLVESIRTFPKMLELRPIVVNDDMVVLGGNMRLKACKEAGIKEVPVIKASDLTEDEQREFIIKDNVGYGEWDWEMLANEWDVAELDQWGMDLPKDMFAKDIDVEEDEVPDLPEEPITRPGDLWIMGEHRLLCGDSTKQEDVNQLLEKQKIGAIITDPPYGIGIDGQKASTSNNPKHNRKAHKFMGWDSSRPPAHFFDMILRMNKPTAIFGGNYFADLLPASRGWIYWNKGQDGLTMSDGELAWTNLSKPLRCVTVNRAAIQGSVHPTQKPIDVMLFAIRYVEPHEGVIFDPYMGSGTTLVASEQLGRSCYGIEIGPEYCDVIVKRWENLTGKKAEHKKRDA